MFSYLRSLIAGRSRSPKAPAAATPERRTRLSLESLERREVPSANLWATHLAPPLAPAQATVANLQAKTSAPIGAAPSKAFASVSSQYGVLGYEYAYTACLSSDPTYSAQARYYAYEAYLYGYYGSVTGNASYYNTAYYYAYEAWCWATYTSCTTAISAARTAYIDLYYAWYYASNGN